MRTHLPGGQNRIQPPSIDYMSNSHPRTIGHANGGVRGMGHRRWSVFLSALSTHAQWHVGQQLAASSCSHYCPPSCILYVPSAVAMWFLSRGRLWSASAGSLAAWLLSFLNPESQTLSSLFNGAGHFLFRLIYIWSCYYHQALCWALRTGTISQYHGGGVGMATFIKSISPPWRQEGRACGLHRVLLPHPGGSGWTSGRRSHESQVLGMNKS